jgi:hypothetical protein
MPEIAGFYDRDELSLTIDSALSVRPGPVSVLRSAHSGDRFRLRRRNPHLPRSLATGRALPQTGALAR